MKLSPILTSILFLVFPFTSLFAQFSLVSSSPLQNAIAVALDTPVTIEFNDPVDPASAVNAVFLQSDLRGKLACQLTTSGRSVTITAEEPFLVAEKITAHVTAALRSASLAPLSATYSFAFTTMNKPSAVTPPKFVDRKIPAISPNEGRKLIPADMDGDGDIDICFVSNKTVWLENDGKGSFSRHIIDENLNYPYYCAVPVDIDMDGDMDVVTASYYGLTTLSNDGNQNFTAKLTAFAGLSASDVDIADFNGDGLPDVITGSTELVGNYYQYSTSIFYNRGVNGFEQAKISAEAFESKGVDLDNDGRWDITQTDGRVLKYLHNTGNAFVPGTLFDKEYSRVTDYELANVNGDEYIDIVLSIFNDATYQTSIETWLNNGAMQFTPKTVVNNGSQYACAGDFNGDGTIDVLTIDGNYNYVAHLNDGHANFTGANVFHPLSEVHTYGTEIPADFDGDGDLDFIGNSVLYENSIPLFEDINAFDPEALTHGDSDWGDYDNDGDLDLLMTGTDSDDRLITKLYQNQGGIFTEVHTDLPDLYLSSCDWGDVDNDGDLDILLMGASAIDTDRRNPRSYLYINHNGVFNLHPSSETLPKAYFGEARLVDLNNDGWLDIAYHANGYSGIYQSDGEGNFTRRYDLPSIFTHANLGVGDYDNDGDQDIALSGWIGYEGAGDYGAMLQVFRNDGDFRFTDLEQDLLGRIGGSLNWTDMDNDGDLDLVASGQKRSSGGGGIPLLTVYENKNGKFEAVENNHEELYYAGLDGATTTGDFNNDGVPDVMAVGDSYDKTLALLQNDGHSQLSKVDVYLPPVSSNNANWVDFDQDNDLDLFVGSRLIVNNTPVKNTAPTPPSAMEVDSVYNNTLYFHWNDGNDQESGATGITYQLYVGTASQQQDIVNSNADLPTGFRKIAESGTLKGKHAMVTQLSGGDYFFGVQSVDAAFYGSPFSAESQYHVIGISGPSASCTDLTISYVAKPAGNYTWEVVGGTIVSGQGSDAISVQWNTTGKGIIKISNALGSRNTLPVDIDKQPQPSVAGDNTVCTGAEEYVITDSKTYFVEWSVSAVHTVENMDRKATITWKEAGEYTLTAKAFPEHKGCFVEDAFEVSVDRAPVPLITGYSLVCATDILTYSNEANDPEWEVVNGTITAKGSHSIDVTWSDPGNGEVIVVEESTRGFCAGYDTMWVTINDLPPTPTLELVQDSILVSSPSPSGNYVWYYNKQEVFAGPYQAVVSYISGEFVVEVFSTNGCGAKSMPFLYYVTGIESAPDQVFSIYPNPAVRYINVLLEETIPTAIHLEMISVNNRIVAEYSYPNSTQLANSGIDVSALAAGVYVIRLKINNKTYHGKFLKI